MAVGDFSRDDCSVFVPPCTRARSCDCRIESQEEGLTPRELAARISSHLDLEFAPESGPEVGGVGDGREEAEENDASDGDENEVVDGEKSTGELTCCESVTCSGAGEDVKPPSSSSSCFRFLRMTSS